LHTSDKIIWPLWINNNLLLLTLALIRLSILPFYNKLFGVSVKFKRVLIGVATISILWLLEAFFGNVFICKPISHYWDPLGKGACVGQCKMLLATNIINMFLDFTLFVLPMPQLVKLNVSIQTRPAIIAVFCIGSGKLPKLFRPGIY
jgi:hypothetical protein